MPDMSPADAAERPEGPDQRPPGRLVARPARGAGPDTGLAVRVVRLLLSRTARSADVQVPDPPGGRPPRGPGPTRRRRALRLSALATATGWVAVAGPAAVPVAAAQPAAGHRAAVIVDTGTEIRRVCVRFAEDSLTGVEVLARAGTDPVLRGFAGKGAAVCSLCGVGCPGDDSCLTCDPGGRFWSYSRAPAGTAALRTSGVGASATTVRDGDVEAWRWGTGGTPPFATVAEVCGEAPPPPPTATTVPAAPEPTAAAVPPATTAPPAPARPRPSTTGAATAATSAPAAPPEATAAQTVAVPAPTSGPATVPAVSTPTSTAATGTLASSPTGDGGDPRGLVAFATALGGLGAWAAVARRRRAPGG